MRTIGITGRSGCGKSQVTAFLRSQGCFVADADLVARQILMDGSPCIPQLTERFNVGDTVSLSMIEGCVRVLK